MSDIPQLAGVPFSFFASLVRNIGRIQPSSSSKAHARRASTGAGDSTPLDYPAARIFARWVIALRSKFDPLPGGTTAVVFRLLFPEEDIRRKYDIQESRMMKLLTDCFGVDASQFDKWGSEEASGCLGTELKLVLQKSCPHSDGFISPLSISEVDALLDELAVLSGYTHPSLRAKYPKGQRRTRKELMRALLRELAPEDAAVLTQIILKDLRPLLYPLTEFHYTTALTRFNTTAVKMLTKEHAMEVWDPTHRFLRFYRVRASLDEAAAFADLPDSMHRDIRPTIGSPIAITKSEKGLSCTHALDLLYGSDIVWAETKYDGERAQIHVEVLADGALPRITIFSKSKRDSTQDRHAVHDLVRSALGLSGKSAAATVKQNVILDAEMVAFRGDKVAEFWHIRQLIEDTAHGIRGRRRSHLTVPYEHESMNSEENEELSLGLVFFDILYLDSKSLLGVPYGTRRELLESYIRIEPGKTILASRYPIQMSPTTQAEDILRRTFAEHIAAHEEGLVLKAGDARYNDYHKPWVKLKKDYIPGHGDCLDMVILGASWEKVRGRSLRVSPSTYTTFYVGALENQKETRQKPPQSPRFHVYFTVAYGLDRKQLEELNFLIKSSDPIPYASLGSKKCDLPFKVTVFKGLNPPPTVILRTPLLAELFGAGFTKTAQSQYYELRFPRIQKLHRPSERDWRHAVSLEELDDIACQSVGRERASKETNDTVKVLFGLPVSPGINSDVKREVRMRKAYQELAKSEGITPSPITPDKYAVENQNNPCPEASSNSRMTPPTLLGNRQLIPLGSKTNVFQLSEEGSYPLAAAVVVPEQIKSTMQLTIPRAPMTPPGSSPPTQARKRPASAHTLKPMREQKKARITHPPPDIPEIIAAGANAPSSSTAAPAALRPSPLLPDIDCDSTLVWFAKADGKPCTVYTECKSRVWVSRPLHSMYALLAGCGWTARGLEVSFVQKGVILIHECDSSSEQWSALRGMLSAEAAHAPRRKRVEVVVYGCTSGLLDRFA